MMIKLIAIDMDGTALNSNREFTPRMLNTLNKAIQQGIHIVPATGRTFSMIPPEIFHIPGIRYVIAANGADTIDLQTNKSIKQDFLPWDEALAVISRLKGFNVHYYVHSNGQHYEPMGSEELLLQHFPHFKDSMQRNKVKDLSEFILAHPNEIEKVGGLCFDADTLQVILEQEKKFGHVNMASTGEFSIEFNGPNASKGNALSYICDLLHISSKHVMVLGDNQNDASMFQYAGYGVAMGNALDEIKELATEVTLSCDEDGAAIAIEKVL